MAYFPICTSRTGFLTVQILNSLKIIRANQTGVKVLPSAVAFLRIVETEKVTDRAQATLERLRRCSLLAAVCVSREEWVLRYKYQLWALCYNV